MQNKNYNVILISLIILVLTITCLVKIDQIDFIDENIYELVNHTDLKTDFYKTITFLGSFLFILVVILICLILNKHINIKNYKILNKIFALTVLIGALSNTTIKLILKRTRPELINLIFEDGFSFPSGHSMNSMIVYGLIIIYVYLFCKNKKLKYFLITLLSFLVLLIGFSRIYLGVHFASDVIAGFIFGIIYLMIVMKIFSKKIKACL